jgi:hypothetical protein
MVCENNARSKFPFDVQHRNIITYDTEAPSDYTKLGSKIVERLTAIDKTEIALEKLAREPPLTEFRGLSAYERIVMTAIVGNLFGVDQATPEGTILREAGKNGLTDFAVSLGLNKLVLKQFIVRERLPDPFDNPYIGYSVTEQGWKWVQENEDQFVLQRPHRSHDPDLDPKGSRDPDLDAEPDDIPF